MEHITLAELAEKSGGKYDTVWRKAKRLFPAETWTKESVLSADHIRVLSGKSAGHSAARPAKKPVERKPSEVAPAADAASTPANMEPHTSEGEEESKGPSLFFRARRFAISTLLFCAVVLHGLLIWYDCSELWGVPGQIGGGAVFVVVLAALLMASDGTLNRTSGYAMWFMAIVDAAACKVHFEVFKTPVVENSITLVLCMFICASSFMALWLFRDSKLD